MSVASQGFSVLSTRQKQNSRIAPLVVPAICAALIAYFAYHAWNGRFGVTALEHLDTEIVSLEFELAGLIAERKKLAHQVGLLDDGGLERDMLDEQSRQLLGLVSPGEAVVLFDGSGTDRVTR